jgi:hypothetical protein
VASWLIPALKAVLPHVGTIISAASPVFTKKKADAANQAALLQQQIGELQAAASQNAANIKKLAAQLQSTVAALRVYCVAAVVLSIIALGAVLLLIAR